MKRIKPIWLYIIFILIMSMIVVISWDDFFWGSHQATNLLNNHFDGYNGRYLGNLIIYFMTRSIFFRIIVYTLTNVGLAFIISKILSNKVRMEYIVLILLTLPIGIFRQTFGWFSGFANYNVSALFILTIFYLVYVANRKWFIPFVLLFLSFFSQFFVENISMVNIIISIIVTIVSLFVDKERLKLTIPWAVGSISGFFIMFQNSAYHSNTSRSVSNIQLSQFYRHILQDWVELYVKESIVLIVLFSLILYVIFNKNKWIQNYLIAFSVYFVLRRYFNITYEQQPLYMLVFELALVILFFIILVYAGLKELEGKPKELYFTFLLSSILMLAPFVVVTPFGPRNILLSYLMLGICLGILWEKLYPTIDVKNIDRLNQFISKIIIFVAMFYLILYSINCFENHRRLTLIREAESTNQKEVEVRRLPFPFLSQELDGIDQGSREVEYKEYNNISNDIDIKVIDRYMPLPWKQTNN